jgi:phosphopantothenoylcysteine decarboxylase/phosphopantothenate--cysteine ligase
VAAHRALDVASELTKRGVAVDAVLTRGAQEFLRPLAFEALTRRPVHTALFGEGAGDAHRSLRLAAEADVLVVVPATADFLAKAAGRACDDLLLTVAYAFPGPKLVAAMNPKMWANPLTARNLRDARSTRMGNDSPGRRRLGLRRPRRRAPPALPRLRSSPASTRPSRGPDPMHVVITAGPTRETDRGHPLPLEREHRPDGVRRRGRRPRAAGIASRSSRVPSNSRIRPASASSAVTHRRRNAGRVHGSVREETATPAS